MECHFLHVKTCEWTRKAHVVQTHLLEDEMQLKQTIYLPNAHNIISYIMEIDLTRRYHLQLS